MQITGELDLPDGGAGAATVIMVPGTGGFDRNVDLMPPDAAAAGVFEELSGDFVTAGLSTIRYDERGHACPRATPDVTRCHPVRDVATVSDATKAADLAAIATAGLARLPDQRCIILFTHSEGIVAAAETVRRGSIRPAGIIALGALMRSPVEAMRWQMVTRHLATLHQVDADNDGLVTVEENDRWRGTHGDLLAVPIPPRSAPFPVAQAQALVEAAYARAASAARSMADDAPFAYGGTVVSSAAWWKAWFSDAEPVVDRLSGYPGPLLLAYGGLDSQLQVEIEAATAERAHRVGRTSVTIFRGVGHTGGTHPLLGPMSATTRSFLVEQALQVSRSCR